MPSRKAKSSTNSPEDASDATKIDNHDPSQPGPWQQTALRSAYPPIVGGPPRPHGIIVTNAQVSCGRTQLQAQPLHAGREHQWIDAEVTQAVED